MEYHSLFVITSGDFAGAAWICYDKVLFSLISHVGPVKPDGHMQRKKPTWSTQVPLFKQGIGAQSSISVERKEI